MHELKTYRYSTKIRISNLILACCLLCVCMTGHQGLGPFISLLNYAVYALLILAVFQERLHITWEFALVVGFTCIAAVLNLIYNVFGSKPHFAFVNSVKAVIYYLMFIYCGYYIALKFYRTDTLFKWIHRISFWAVSIVIAQSILHRFGIYLNRLPVVGRYLFHAVDTVRYFRPSAFFSEPSYLAEVVLLDLYINLYIKRDLRRAAVDFLGLLISTSSLGIVFGFALIVWWVLTNQISKNKLVNTALKVTMLAACSGVLFYFLTYTGTNAIINRILNGATLSQRTLRSFELYSKMQPAERFFGIGMQNLGRYINTYTITLVHEGMDTMINKEFAQSFGYILCTLGVFGVLGYSVLLILPFKKLSKKTNGIGILMICLSLTASLITRQYFSVLLAVIWTVIFKTHPKGSGQETEDSQISSQ